MAWANVQLPSTPLFLAAGSATKTWAYASNVTSGNLLALFFFNDAGETITATPTDTRGSTYVKACDVSVAGLQLYIYIGVTPGSGANTVSTTWASTTGNALGWLLEFSGNASSTPIDTHNTSSSASAATVLKSNRLPALPRKHPGLKAQLVSI